MCKHELFKWTEIQKSFSYFATEYFRELDSCHLKFLLQEVLLLHQQNLNGTAKTFEGSCPRLTILTRGVINSELQLFARFSKLLWSTVHLLLQPSAAVQIFFSLYYAFHFGFLNVLESLQFSTELQFCLCHHKKWWLCLYTYIEEWVCFFYFQKLDLSVTFQELEQLHKMTSSLSDTLHMWISIT